MATLENVKEAVALYLGQSASTFIEGSTDVLLQELNEVRRAAELEHDFEILTDTLRVDVDSSGGIIDEDYDTTSGRKYKTVKAAWLVSDQGVRTPLTWRTKGDLHEARLKQARRERVTWPLRVLPDVGNLDLDTYDYSRTTKLYIEGETLKLDPPPSGSTSYQIELDVHTWWDDWTDYTADDTDFFVRHGKEYLKWGTIRRLNFVIQKWVPRIEGTLPHSGIEKIEKEALQRLIKQDDYFEATARRPFL